jgi:hypothetical protein
LYVLAWDIRGGSLPRFDHALKPYSRIAPMSQVPPHLGVCTDDSTKFGRCKLQDIDHFVLSHVSYGVDLEAVGMIEVHGTGLISSKMTANSVDDEEPRVFLSSILVLDIFV